MPTDPALRLRPARPEESLEIAAVHLRARAVAPMPPAGTDRHGLAAQFRAAWTSDEFWVAVTGEQPERVIGYVRYVVPDGERVGWLDDLYVDPAWAGRGVGSALLSHVRVALPDGFGLWAFVRNHPARSFYRSRGVREVALVTAEESPTGEAEVELRWP